MLYRAAYGAAAYYGSVFSRRALALLGLPSLLGSLSYLRVFAPFRARFCHRLPTDSHLAPCTTSSSWDKAPAQFVLDRLYQKH